MRWYARGPRMIRQVLADLGMVLWTLIWLGVARFTHRRVDAMGAPSRATARSLRSMIEQLEVASRQFDRIPGVGDEMGLPFRLMARGLADMATQSESQASSISSSAMVASVLVFLVPVGVLVAMWLPQRLRFAEEAATSQRWVDEEADLDLFALRAMANVPMQQIARVSSDPVGAWREGDPDVIRRLAKLELRRLGLKMPATTVQTGAGVAAVPAERDGAPGVEESSQPGAHRPGQATRR